MLKNTVISILRSFSREEIIKFDDFLKSPYFNKKRPVQNLFAEIKKYYPGLDSSELEKDKVWKKLYPGREYNYGVMKNLIHDLTKLAEQFITQEEYRQNEIQEFKNLYASLSRRKLRNSIEAKDIQIQKKFSDISKNSAYTINEFYGQLSKTFEIRLWNKYLVNEDHDVRDIVLGFRDNFVTGVLSHMINVYYQTRVQLMVDKNETPPTHLIEEVLNCLTSNTMERSLEEIRKRSETKYVILKSYYLAYRAVTLTDNSMNYSVFKKFFMENYKSFPYHFLKDMDTYLCDSLSYLSEEGFDKRSEWKSVHEFRLNNGLIADRENQLSSNQFIPWMFLYLDDLDITGLKQYIAYCKKYLIDEDREASIMFSEAFELFFGKDYAKALLVLQKVNFRDGFLKNVLRKFCLMVYYELNDYEGFELSHDAHKHFLNYRSWSNKDWAADYLRKSRLFSSLIDKLFKARESGERSSIQRVEDEIRESDVDNKKWFFRKIEELKNPLK